jgi:Kef-type K+ transport system membrane component KefB
MSGASAFTIILIVAAAFVLPLVAARLSLPAVVLEIIFGIAAGRAGLGLIEHAELLDFLAEFGFLLLMFLSGFEIDFAAFQRQGGRHLFVALAVFGVTLVLANLIARSLGYGFFLTFLLATTSMGLVVPALRGTHRTQTRAGQAILVSAAIADFLTMLGVVVYASVVEDGMGWQLLRVPALFGAIVLTLVFLKGIVWWYPEKFERLFSSQDPEEMGIRTSLALLFVFVGLSLALRIEPILGAFLAGSVFALVFPHRGSLERELKAFSYGFLIPIFFINIGLHFEFGALLDRRNLELAGLLLAAAFLVKLAPAMLLLFLKISLREAAAAGMILSARLSLIIAIAALGVRLALLDPAMEAAVILLAAVTATICPTLFRVLAPPLQRPDKAA